MLIHLCNMRKSSEATELRKILKERSVKELLEEGQERMVINREGSNESERESPEKD